MTGAHRLTAVALAFGLAACAPADREREPVTAGIDSPARTEAMQTTVTGCVVEQNNQFMLTQVDQVAPVEAVPVQTYHLVGEDQQLRQMMNQRVQVIGAVEQSPMARQDMRPGEAVGTTGQPDAAAPADRGAQQHGDDRAGAQQRSDDRAPNQHERAAGAQDDRAAGQYDRGAGTQPGAQQPGQTTRQPGATGIGEQQYTDTQHDGATALQVMSITSVEGECPPAGEARTPSGR